MFYTLYTARPARYEEIKSSSLTVPDQALTVQQIITRYASGMPPAISQQGFYAEEYDYPFDDPDFDLADLPGLIEKTNLRLDQLKRMYDDYQNNATDKRRDKTDNNTDVNGDTTEKS